MTKTLSMYTTNAATALESIGAYARYEYSAIRCYNKFQQDLGITY